MKHRMSASEWFGIESVAMVHRIATDPFLPCPSVVYASTVGSAQPTNNASMVGLAFGDGIADRTKHANRGFFANCSA